MTLIFRKCVNLCFSIEFELSSGRISGEEKESGDNIESDNDFLFSYLKAQITDILEDTRF
jgi:hypothetical protein